MKPLSDFYPQVQPYISNVPAPTMDLALVTAATSFCQDTKAIHARQPVFSTSYGVQSYTVTPPTDQRVCAARDVWVNGRHLRPWMRDQSPGPDDAMGQPTHFYGYQTGSGFAVVLYPTPDDAYDVIVDAAFAPVRSAASLDDNLFELWIDAIRAGALAHLHAIPGQPFSDMNLAANFGMSFMAHTAKAKRKASFGGVEGGLRVDPRPIV